jgi:hypothetical protein
VHGSLDLFDRPWPDGDREHPGRPARRLVEKSRHLRGAVAVGPSLMPSDHHGVVPTLRSMALTDDGQLHVSVPVRPRMHGLAGKQDGDALFAQASVLSTRDEVPAAAPANLADRSSPAATMTRSRALTAKVRSHISLSTRSTTSRQEMWCTLSLFGGSANSGSPVTLRPPLAEGLPFRLLQQPH